MSVSVSSVCPLLCPPAWTARAPIAFRSCRVHGGGPCRYPGREREMDAFIPRRLERRKAREHRWLATLLTDRDRTSSPPQLRRHRRCLHTDQAWLHFQKIRVQDTSASTTSGQSPEATGPRGCEPRRVRHCATSVRLPETRLGHVSLKSVMLCDEAAGARAFLSWCQSSVITIVSNFPDGRWR